MKIKFIPGPALLSILCSLFQEAGFNIFLLMSDDERHPNGRSRKGERVDFKGKGSELFEKRLKKSLRIDPRYSILDFQSRGNFLHIFTDSITNAIRISRIYRNAIESDSASASPQFKIKVVLLPDKSAGKFDKGICHVGAAPVRKSAESPSEQVTQVLYGESFDNLQIMGDWVRVRLHADGYVGWVSSNQVTLFTEEDFNKYQALPKVNVIEQVLPLFQKPTEHSSVQRDAVFGSALAVVGRHHGFLKIKLPDGLLAYTKKSGTTESFRTENFSLKGLLATARSFQGTSYVWGGRSPNGFDCSGFMQTIFRANGIELPEMPTFNFLPENLLGRVLRKCDREICCFFRQMDIKLIT